MRYIPGYIPFFAGLVMGLFVPLTSANPSDACVENISAAPKNIKLGMSTALSGPLQFNGLSASQGIQKRIAEANCDPFWRSKGIQFELIILDDGYDPDVAALNTQKLIDEHKVIALVGNLGTPTASRTWKIANDKHVVFYAAFTGTNVLRLTPPAPYVFNYRPGYDQEMERIVADIVSRGIPISSIGVFLQNDAFGNSGLESLRKNLSNVCGDCQDDVLQMRYERNSLKNNFALQTFITADEKPKAIILIATLEPSIAFIRFAQRLSPDIRFYGLSNIDRAVLGKKLDDLSNITLSRIVPGNFKKSDSPENPMYEEGYKATQLLLDSMHTIRGDINSQSLRSSLLELELKLPGRAGDQQMMNDVWLSEIKNKTEQGIASHVK